MTMSFNGKALGAFKNLGAVVLMVTTIFFVACNQTSGGGKPTPTPKHAITFSVDGTTPNGTLKAKVDGVPETTTSPITVEKGKTVTFTAKADTDYVIKDMEGFAGLFYRRRTSRQPHCQGNCYRRCDGECNFC